MEGDVPSKTRRKVAMLELQELGAAMIDLPGGRLETLGLPEDLAHAIQEASRITSHGARRRQLQYIGKLMREVDPEPIRAALEEFAGSSRTAIARRKQLERWRSRLIEDDGALTEFARAHPAADLQALRTLIRNARKERAEARAPRAQRELFRILRDAEERRE
jgi:ribosome-associated protein